MNKQVVQSPTTEELIKDCIRPDGSLYSLGWYLRWRVGDTVATLNGLFTANDLEAIARHMRARYGK
jgi:hypothetical protein